MPVLLKDFLTNHEASDLSAPLLEKMHRTAPAVRDTLTSPHYSATYKKLPDLSSEQRVFQTTWQFLVSNTMPGFKDPKASITFFKESITPEKGALMLRAFVFESSDIGNCSHRASYAAMKLFGMLKDTSIKISVEAIGRERFIDQVIVVLSNETTKEKFVYDPLTNPELVFGFDEYEKDILPCFKLSPVGRLGFSCKIDEELCRQYQNLTPRLRQDLAVQVGKLNKQVLKLNSMVMQPISLREGKPTGKMLDAVCEQLKDKFGKHTLVSIDVDSEEGSKAEARGPR